MNKKNLNEILKLNYKKGIASSTVLSIISMISQSTPDY